MKRRERSSKGRSNVGKRRREGEMHHKKDEDEEFGDIEGIKTREADEGGERRDGQYRKERTRAAKKRKVSHDFEVPRMDEVAAMRDAADVVVSGNLWRLQLDDEFKEIHLKLSSTLEKKVIHKLGVFKKIALGVEWNKVDSNAAMARFVPRSQYPWVSETALKSFILPTPSDMHVVGSFLLQTQLVEEASDGSRVPVISLGLVWPAKGVFGNRDHLNHVYASKRLCFLSSFADFLTSKDAKSNLLRIVGKDEKKLVKNSVFHVEFDDNGMDDDDGNSVAPVLVIRWHFGMEEEERIVGDGNGDSECAESFEMQEIVLRIMTVFDDEPPFPLRKLHAQKNAVRDSSVENIELQKPTPAYNFCILHDCLLLKLMKDLHSLGNTFDHFVEIVVLVKKWFLQRTIDVQQNVWDDFLITSLVGSILSKRSDAAHFPVYELLIMCMERMSSMEKQNAFSKEWNAVARSVREEFASDIVFLDPSQHWNLFQHVSTSDFKALQKWSSSALKLLQVTNEEECVQSFDEMFLVRGNSLLVHDAIIEVGKEFVKNVAAARQMESLLGKCLQSRVDIARFLGFEGDWARFGLVFGNDPLGVSAVVVKGPSADEKESVASFKEFWGEEKAHVRKFPDLSILVCCLFENSSDTQGSVILDIVRHVLKRHMSIPEEMVQGRFLPAKREIVPHRLQVDEDFASLAALIRSIPDTSRAFPLPITRIDRCFRTPRLHPIPIFKSSKSPWSPTQDVLPFVFELGSSVSWPNEDVEARKSLAKGFLVDIAKILQTKHSVRCFVCDDHMDLLFRSRVYRGVVLDPESVKILYKSGELLKAHMTDFFFHKRVEHAQRIASFFSELADERHIFEVAVDFALDFIRRIHLEDYIRLETVQLLMMYVIEHHEPHFKCRNPRVLFLRWLSFVARFAFSRHKLVVRFGHDSVVQPSANSVPTGKGESHWAPNRAEDVILIQTPMDPVGNLWTQNSPNAAVMGRLQLICKRMISSMSCRGGEGVMFDGHENLVGVSDYDIVIHLQHAKSVLHTIEESMGVEGEDEEEKEEEVGCV
eukprot:TRINITY_DN1106_c1_g1_i1.p1 TRINITY_DN1106_c1_g1~~TRINITY_DN1106_c1_g1_i1.p1  ORF type:complete len:1047 (-),score=316.53 TRINITY_DN1106_c1_g1_i1:620-3760(-)